MADTMDATERSGYEPGADTVAGYKCPDDMFERVVEAAKQDWSDREPAESKMIEQQELCQPGRMHWRDLQVGTENTYAINDVTAVLASRTLAGRLYAGMTPMKKPWLDIKPGGEVEDTTDNLAKCQRIKKKLFYKMEGSKLHLALPEVFHDILLGVGCLMITQDEKAKRRRKFAANVDYVPNSKISYHEGRSGQIIQVNRKDEYRLSEIKTMWGVDTLPTDLDRMVKEKPTNKIEIEDSSYLTELPDPNNADQTMDVWGYVAYWRNGESRHKIAEAAYYENPFIVARWAGGGSGAAFGNGVIEQVMPAIRMVNQLKWTHVENLLISMCGMWMVQSNSVANTHTFEAEPGATWPVGTMDDIRKLDVGGDFQFGQLGIEGEQRDIQRGMYVPQLPDPSKGPRTATEWDYRHEDFLEEIHGPFLRLTYELTIPIGRRFLGLMLRANEFDTDDVEILAEGDKITLVPTSPLARLEAVKQLSQLAQYLEAMKGVAAAQGSEFIGMVVKLEEIATEFAKLYDIDMNLVRSEEERAEAMEQVQQMKQQAMAEQAEAQGAQGPQGPQGPEAPPQG